MMGSMRKGCKSMVSWLFPQMEDPPASSTDAPDEVMIVSSEEVVGGVEELILVPSDDDEVKIVPTEVDVTSIPAHQEITILPSEDEEVVEIVPSDDDEIEFIKEVKNDKTVNHEQGKPTSYQELLSNFQGFQALPETPPNQRPHRRGGKLLSKSKKKLKKNNDAILKPKMKNKVFSKTMRERDLYMQMLQNYLVRKLLNPIDYFNKCFHTKIAQTNLKESDNETNGEVKVISHEADNDEDVVIVSSEPSGSKNKADNGVCDEVEHIILVDSDDELEESDYESEDEQYYNNKIFERKECNIAIDSSEDVETVDHIGDISIDLSKDVNTLDHNEDDLRREKALKDKLLDQEKSSLHSVESRAASDQLQTPCSQSIVLSEEMIAEVEEAFKVKKDEVLVSAYNLQITGADIKTLKGLNWLNDEVINFYLALVSARSSSSVYCFSTFFYPRLEAGGHKVVARWTKKVDIFSFKLLLVPIHLGMHWCLVAADLATMTVTYYDSMGGSNPSCLDSLGSYLQEEYVTRKGGVLAGFSKEEEVRAPRQMNGSDCGMFVLMYAERLARGVGLEGLRQQDMQQLRLRVGWEVLHNRLLQFETARDSS